MIFEHLKSWDDKADDGIRQASGDKFDGLKARVKAGEATLYKVHHEEGGNSWLIVCDDSDGVLYVEAYQGKKYVQFCKALIGRCRALGVKSMRFDTKDARIVRVWQRVAKKTGCRDLFMRPVPMGADFVPYEVEV